MRRLWAGFRWLLAVVLLLLLASWALRGAWLAALLLGVAGLLVVPAVDGLRETRFPRLLHPASRAGIVLASLMSFAGLLRASSPDSVYASERVR